jgi:hypothetical protein
LGGFSLVKNIGVSSNLKNGRVQIPFDSKTFTVLTPDFLMLSNISTSLLSAQMRALKVFLFAIPNKPGW